MLFDQQYLVLGAVAAAITTGIVTHWPVGALLAGFAVLLLPQVLRPERSTRTRTERLEAIAAWTEALRDTLAAAAGIEQALRASAISPPPAVASEVAHLVARLEHGDRLADALRDFADELDDATGDLVAAALVMAAERQAGQLRQLLGALAEAARAQVAARLKIDAERARVRTSVRVVIAVTLSMAVGLVLLNRPYLEPFDSAGGQVALALVGSLFAAAFAWMARIARLRGNVRVLAADRAEAEVGRPWS
ncbi:type II secretion system F family protein [Yinghuangia soli]|uniref:Type II secretion system F family protein n=1 Tax=Yinghuangia soli TaxID=2908204 RepID=A0AA41Q425_9ACTN|nr:type II secretion system F family protein [Yinghuangia soli]MCF2531160.1 type II secretion system F family protein [Yinghuangia soli]